MNFRNYLQKSISMKGLSKNQFGSLTGSNINTDKLKNISLFNSASLDDLKNLDWQALLNNANAAVSSDNADTQALNDIVSTLMEIDGVQQGADINGDGTVSEEEAMSFFTEMMAKDGDDTTLTYADIDKALKDMGIDLEEVADKAIQDALEDEAIQDKKEKEELEGMGASDGASSPSSTSGAGGGGGGNYGDYGNNGASKTNAAQQKTAAEEVEELEKQKQEIITEADQNISAKETEKDELVEKSDKVNDELKKEYQTAQNNLKETESAISETESTIDECNSTISGIENEISALEGEKGALSTSTGDEEVDKQNQSRLGEIDSQIQQKNTEKEEANKKLQEAEQKLTELQEKQKEQETKLAEVEAKIAEADPELATKMEKINGEIQDLKTQKTNDVKDIDAKIEAKRAEAKDEAKDAGKSKGNAANSIGSGLVELASKYMGYNEADGSYKLFTNGRSEAWCADFVTYCVKEFAEKQGLNIKDGFGSPAVANLMGWAQNNNVFNNITGMSSAEKEKFLQSDLKPGDVIIWKSNGSSHTGLIKSINSDGTFETIEGNTTGDQVRSNHKSIHDKSLTGFIKFSDIVA